jgi:hypothetical protein
MIGVQRWKQIHFYVQKETYVDCSIAENTWDPEAYENPNELLSVLL